MLRSPFGGLGGARRETRAEVPDGSPGKEWANMKEFDKKGNPSREPSSEGMKGLSKFLPMTDSNYRRRLPEYEVQVQDLQAYVRSLETETGRLRKKLEDAPKEFMILENKLREANRQLVQAFNQNEKLVNTLYEAREQITSLKEEVDKLCAPPSTYGVFLSINEDATVNILSQGRKVKGNLHPSIKAEEIKPGQELVLNEGLNVVETAGYEIQGEVVVLKEVLDEERAIVTQRADEDRVGIIADPLRQVKLKIGDHLLIDAECALPPGEAPKERGRGPLARGSARHLLRRHRRARQPDRKHQRRGRAALPLRRLLQRAPPRAAQGGPPVRTARLRQDHDRQGGRQQPGRPHLGEARREGQGLLPQHQGPRAAQQVRGRDRAEDPRDLHQGPREGGRGRAGGGG